jgi:hypothetical protein
LQSVLPCNLETIIILPRILLEHEILIVLEPIEDVDVVNESEGVGLD